MTAHLPFFGQDELLERIRYCALESGKRVAFLVGAPLTGARQAGDLGVSSVNEIVEMIKGEFVDDQSLVASFDDVLARADNRPYQRAFEFLQWVRVQDRADI